LARWSTNWCWDCSYWYGYWGFYWKRV